jgi:plastocyanin
MRRPLIAFSLVLLALGAAACTASAAPGWTYAPPTEPPASQAPASGEPSSAPTTAPSGQAPTDAPTGQVATEAPSASGGGGGGGDATVQLTAHGIAFEQATISAPADTAFTIHFDNQDLSTPHNVAIVDASGQQVFLGNTITGPAQADYQVPALPAGTYTFKCTIHPAMTGTLTVGG